MAGVGSRQRAMAHTLLGERAVARWLRLSEVRSEAHHVRVIAGELLAMTKTCANSVRARSDVVGKPFRAIPDDDLLRFFAVCETAGMLG